MGNVMDGRTLLQWSEPPGARIMLARSSGGLQRLFVLDLFSEGIPVVVFMSAIWIIVLVAGAPVMPFWRAFLLFSGLAVAIAIVELALFLLVPGVRITALYFYVGARRWRNRSIESWAWETQPVADAIVSVLVLKLHRSQFIRVALAPQMSQESVEQALADAGVAAT